MKLVKTGKVYRLGHVYESAMPVFPGDEGWHMEPRPVQVVGGPQLASSVFHPTATRPALAGRFRASIV